MTYIADKYNQQIQGPQISQLQADIIPMEPHTSVTGPTGGDDAGAGFPDGKLWIDTTSEDAYISVSSATGAAVWKKITP